MQDIIKTWIYGILASGCICSLLLYFNPDGKTKLLFETGCACIMVLSLLSPFEEWGAFAKVSQELHDWTTLKSYDFDYDTYIKSFMESEYGAYIRSEANRQGLSLTDVAVSVICDESGNWLPYEITYYSENAVQQDFKEYIAKNLGVAEERQYVNDEN